MDAIDITKTHWSYVQVWDAYERSSRITDPTELRKCLLEYRAKESINGYFLADPADYPDDVDGEICVAGPGVDEIDWTGIDDVLEE